MQQPTLDARIASASERDYGDLIALLEAASLPTEDLERSRVQRGLQILHHRIGLAVLKRLDGLLRAITV